MNRNEFEQWAFEEYPTVFNNTFSREMLQNILDYAEGMEYETQYSFLCTMIPEVPERIIRQISL